MTLFRPVGLKELELIAESGWRAFPPRLEWQPFFYPVLNVEYAEQIARDWNTTDDNSGHSGFVTRFDVDDAFVSRYDVQIVGSAKVHKELWVPAEELDAFNTHVLAPIEVVASYYGERFSGERDARSGLPTSLVSFPRSAEGR
ncbi:MAG: ADP-ribosylation/crystallin J1 [Bacteroidota bacterium]